MTDKKMTLWGSASAMHPALIALSESLAQDLPLADADLRASAAYAHGLAKCGVLTEAEAQTLSDGLMALRTDLANGTWIPTAVEDIHAAIETELTDRFGDVGQKLHTGRSRNDQVSTAFRLAARERVDGLVTDVKRLQSVIADRAKDEIDTLVPSYTHVQRAQPIRLAQWLLAHFFALQRDVERLRQAHAMCNVMPLGSGAVSGHPFNIDREAMAKELGFSRPTDNSLDSVGDRDFVCDVVYACSMTALHLSRLAEELVIWSSAEFAFVKWPSGLATGSSLMPNKKNPDLAELVRGQAGPMLGDLTSILVLVKGLPMSYQRDLQEDKPPLWRATQRMATSLHAMEAAMQHIEFARDKMRAALSDEVLATEVADRMVARGIPFRRAHHGVAAIMERVRDGQDTFATLAQANDLPSPLVPEDFAKLDMLAAIERRTATGGTAKSAILKQLERARALLG
ncbi:MAG: argininosuccinate lyase [Clostridia bacterium]|nr:argininosuccinate lyase [Deltaproteobacteria bacterium]